MLRDKVVTIHGSKFNDNTRTVARAVNKNADVLKELCDEVENLKRQISRLKEQKNKNK